jgi:hypothetical protein
MPLQLHRVPQKVHIDSEEGARTEGTEAEEGEVKGFQKKRGTRLGGGLGKRRYGGMKPRFRCHKLNVMELCRTAKKKHDMIHFLWLSG